MLIFTVKNKKVNIDLEKKFICVIARENIVFKLNRETKFDIFQFQLDAVQKMGSEKHSKFIFGSILNLYDFWNERIFVINNIYIPKINLIMNNTVCKNVKK